MEVFKGHGSQHNRCDATQFFYVLGIKTDKILICRKLARLNINLQKLTQLIVTLILPNGRRNQGQDFHQSSTLHFRALTRFALKNMGQCVGNFIIGPSGVLDTKFKRVQSQQPHAKPTYVFNTLEKPTQVQVIAVDFEILMIEITSTLLTTK